LVCHKRKISIRFLGCKRIDMINNYTTDILTIPRLNVFLEKFHKVGSFSWSFRCPVCGDSEKRKNVTRGYIFQNKGNFFVKCHNCSYSSSLSWFIKNYTDQSFYREYLMQKFNRSEKIFKTVEKEIPITNIAKFYSLCSKCSLLNESHEAIEYLKGRKIEDIDRFFYIDDFSKLQSLFIDYDKFPKDKRIIIPYYDKQKNLFALQGRALDKSCKLRYITLKFDKSKPLIYGLDSHDKTKKTYVTEGPLDSLFLPNALAATGSDFKKLENYVEKNKSFIIMDNEPRNKQIVMKYVKNIDMGYSIFIPPVNINFKDINDMILLGYTSEQICVMIDKNVFSGLKAKLKLSKWKKC
jgi:hypothetical protein